MAVCKHIFLFSVGVADSSHEDLDASHSHTNRNLEIIRLGWEWG